MNLTEFICRIIEFFMGALAYVVSSLKAGNIFPACLLALVIILLIDKDVLKLSIIVFLCYLLMKAVIK